MTKERFFEILREERVPEGSIEALWRKRPGEDDVVLQEDTLRFAARLVWGNVLKGMAQKSVELPKQGPNEK